MSIVCTGALIASCGDNIVPGGTSLVVTRPDALRTTEGGGNATFTVTLSNRPAGTVTIAVASSLATEGTVSPSTVELTPDNFDIPVTVTVTGVDDDRVDGDQAYQVQLDGGDAGTANVDVTNEDNDDIGASVTPTSGLVTTEAGGTATFTVVLDTQPSAEVTIPIASADAGEGTASPASLTFTVDNWNAPQTVTLTGVNDDLADGAQAYTIEVGAATSADPGYSGFDPADVMAMNVDDDSPGILVTPTAGIVTSEAGGSATFSVVLAAQPTADVTIAVSSSDAGEGAADAAALTFTPVNWNAPQIVTVTGADDAVADGPQSYTIVLAAATSSDTGYAGVDPADVAVTNIDNDTAGVTVTPTSGLATTESGGSATFTVVLNTQPTTDVTIAIASDDAGEGTAAPASVTFTPLDWDAPQTVTVTGVDDALADGNQPYRVVLAPAVSGDASYAGLDPADVALTNIDNDTAGVIVTPASGLQTTESGGTASFTIVLTAEPTGTVTIPLSSSDTGEGTVGQTEVVFTPLDWDAPQVVTVTGVDDALADGNQVFAIVTGAATSTDPAYAGLDAGNVSITNLDDDTAGILVFPTSGLSTTEAGGTATFTVVLLSEPTANVTIDLSSSDTGEGTVSPAQLVFTPANFNAPQTVTVTGADDAVADGNQPYSIVTAAAVSADTGYAGLDAANVGVTNLDDDAAGIVVTPTSGLTTTEGGGTATFTVVLLSQPTANVTIPIATSDATEGTASPAQLVFTPANFDAPQTVTVTGVDDAVADGNQLYSIVTGAAVSADPGYDGLDADNVSVTNLDNDVAGILVSPTQGLLTTEAGGTATFTVVLLSEPTGNVTIPLSSSDLTEGSVSPSQLVFTPANFDAPQTVTITGLDDAIVDGNQPYTIVTGLAVSTDPAYSGRNATNVSVRNLDNDTAGILVSPTAGLITTEAGGSDSFNVVLTSQPTADVAISVSSTKPGEGTTSVATLIFTPANFAAPQTVTVTGVDDLLIDGNQVYTIVLGAAVSADPAYANLDPADVGVTNLDNDSAGIRVTPTTGLVTTEAGGSDVFTVVLLAQPTANVTIAVASSDLTEGTVVPATLTFTPADFNVPKSVTVTGVNDATADGNQAYQVVLAPAVSSDPQYAGIDASDVSVTNTDDDTPGFFIDPVDLIVSEFGDFDTFDVRLTSQPTADVTITLTSSDLTEGTVSPVTLTFTPANFNVPQTVTVTGVDDALADGDQIYAIVTGVATSADPGYAGIDPPDVRVTTTDNETPGVFVQARRKLFTTESGGLARFRMRLNTQPTAPVTCTLSSSDLTEGQVSPQTVVFTPANFAQAQTITVIGLDDAVLDGDQLYTIVLAPCTSADPAYNGIDPRDVTVINRDNE
ncbi:MAG TPA: Calx-beta domain-containing protein [Kofleriaceae bacterium]|nr:Calx-beta domain-containing protein [Kofleriaceae bacterium]